MDALEVKQTVRQVVNLIMFYAANEKQENGEAYLIQKTLQIFWIKMWKDWM